MIPRMPVQQFIRFNLVGILGAAVQLAALSFCTRQLGIGYVIATATAVEIALLHNFGWHELWTWTGLPPQGWPMRLLRFHVGNGVSSILGNTLLTFAFHEFFRVPVILANMAAIISTGLLNFGLAKFWVFREES